MPRAKAGENPNPENRARRFESVCLPLLPPICTQFYPPIWTMTLTPVIRAINNPRVSEAAKRKDQAMLDEQYGGGGTYEPSSGEEGEKMPQNVARGLKAYVYLTLPTPINLDHWL
jgi:Conidiation protein 6.